MFHFNLLTRLTGTPTYNAEQINIPVLISDRANMFTMHQRHKNNNTLSSNLIQITIGNSKQDSKGTKQVKLPRFLLLNSRSLLPKLDERNALLSLKPVDVIAVTESWLHEYMNSNLLSVTGYNLSRKDRVIGRGGGVCVYIKNDIPCIRRTYLECENLKCLWLSLRPKRRPFSAIVNSVVYHPPGRTSSEHNDLNEHLINTIDLVRNLHTDHGLVILGDFNDFEIRTLIRSHNLKQVVDQPTRESTILGLTLSLQTCTNYMITLQSLLL